MYWLSQLWLDKEMDWLLKTIKLIQWQDLVLTLPWEVIHQAKWDGRVKMVSNNNSNLDQVIPICIQDQQNTHLLISNELNYKFHFHKNIYFI